jgi:hypothetical protein
MLWFPDDAVLARLAGVTSLASIQLAPDLAEAMRTPPRSGPALFVAFQTQGQPSEISGPTVQGSRTTAIQLVLWVRNSGTPQRVLAERKAVAEAIDARLLGWVPDDAVDEIYLLAARDDFAHGAWLVSQLIYRATWTYSGAKQS